LEEGFEHWRDQDLRWLGQSVAAGAFGRAKSGSEFRCAVELKIVGQCAGDD
jgi:hypothetical protein